MRHLYEPIEVLKPVATALEGVRINRFGIVTKPHEIAMVTWTNRAFGNHTARNAAYCKRHGYTCILNATRRLPHLPHTFEKLALVRWALHNYDVVLEIDDDASIHRSQQQIQDFLRIFPTSSIIASNAGWDVPVAKGKMATTWDVSSTVNPANPPGAQPSAYSLQGGVILWRRSAYTITLLDMLLENNASHCLKYANKCCYEQDAINAATRTTWMIHVGILPMHAFNCFPGDLNTYGRCVNPFVLHIAGMKSKDAIHASMHKMRGMQL